MIDLPTLIALLVPVLLLFIVDQVARRVLARRRPRAVVEPVAPQMLGPAGRPITANPATPATRRAADARRVA